MQTILTEPYAGFIIVAYGVFMVTLLLLTLQIRLALLRARKQNKIYESRQKNENKTTK